MSKISNYIEKRAKKVLHVFSVLLLLFPLLSQSVGLVISSPLKRIVGGEHVLDIDTSTSSTILDRIDQWPWVVALTSQNSQFCGASLVAPNWLLTAAHCVYDAENNNIDSTKTITAVFLRADLARENIHSFSRQVTKIVAHPDYNYALDLNDMALLQLDQAVTTIKPVVLPGTSFDAFTVAAGTTATVLGWGITQDSSDSEIVLRKVELPVTEQSVCSAAMADDGINLEDSMLCAGFAEGRKDSCSGDSGGPLVYFSDSLQKWVQIGLVSFGIGCAEPNEYGAYTRISKYTKSDRFISSTICETLPIAPEMQISKDNQTYRFNFSSTDNGARFRLYYAQHPSATPIYFINITGSEFVITLPENAAYYVAAESQVANCVSPLSEIKVVNL
jgi:secreted trypsin-like serine protease